MNHKEACAEAERIASSLVPPLQFYAVPILTRTDHSETEWDESACHFLCTFKRGTRSESFQFSLGHGHRQWKRTGRGLAPDASFYTRSPSYWISKYRKDSRYYRHAISASEAPPPSMADVLDCLDSDARACSVTFSEWCNEFGFDEDSRKAEMTYRACDETGKRLARILSNEDRESILRPVRGF